MYQNFVTEVQEILQERLGEQVKVTEVTSLKNNDFKRIGLNFSETGSNIAPTIYMEEYYRQYQSEWEIDEIVESVIRLYEEVKFESCFDVEEVRNFEKAKNVVSYKLISYDMNQQLLKNVPHVKYLDFAIVFYLILEKTEKGSATILITNDMANYWDMTEEELYKLAEENSPILLPAEFLPMRVVINQLMGKEITQEELGDNCMYVLSNKHRHFGAITLLYKGVLEEIGNELGTDFYILPSSIHETIILPVDSAITQEELNEMIEEINQTQVQEEDILSNHAYYYDRVTKELR